MALRYACFLSYQRGNDLLDRFVRELFQALSNELALGTDLPVWFDTERLQPGEAWRSHSAQALASSVCIVPVLTPTYFSGDRAYCSREYLGMQWIEQRRWQMTGQREGIILPVVFRGGDRLPMAARQGQWLDFSDYLAFGPKQFRSSKFAQSVSLLAKAVLRLCETYKDLDEIDSREFALPSEHDVDVWLQGFKT